MRGHPNAESGSVSSARQGALRCGWARPRSTVELEVSVTIDWTQTRRDTVRAFCDTIFASLPAEPGDADAHGFWARKASDAGVDLAVAELLGTAVPALYRPGLMALVD